MLASDAFTVGGRLQMNFNPGSTRSEWYGGTVGLKLGPVLHVGFDDGDVRQFADDKLRNLLELGVIKSLPSGESNGLVHEWLPSDWRVLVGEHKPKIAGLTIYVAHHVDTNAFTADSGGAGRTRTKRAGGKETRKGYHTYRCGDVVRSLVDGKPGVRAVVDGVILATISKQLRRFLVLCEGGGTASEKPGAFFMGAWSAWSRVPSKATV
eukprot:1739608-Pleurochrysis_carterae.AAC.1